MHRVLAKLGQVGFSLGGRSLGGLKGGRAGGGRAGRVGKEMSCPDNISLKRFSSVSSLIFLSC